MVQMNENNVASIVPTKPDKELAEEFKQRTIEALRPLMAILDEATKHGFHVNFNLGEDMIGRSVVQNISITKKFA